MTHINVRDVLDSLTLAKEAYDAVPDLRRQIDDLQAAVASKDRLLSQTQSQLEETIHGKANVEAKLKEVESDRDDYFLRAEEAQEKLDKMAQLIGVGTGKAVSPVEQPATASEPVTSGQSATDPTHQTPQTTVSPVTTTDTGSEAKEPVGPTSTTTGTTEPIGVTKGQSEVHPIASSEAAPVTTSTAASTDAYSNTQSDHGDETKVIDLKPYEGRPSWEKPHDMSWGDWEAKGGTIPQWMKQHG